MTIDMRMTRQLPATPAEVFDAYTDAEQQKIWFSILDEQPARPAAAPSRWSCAAGRRAVA